jgi:hypothetical protein
MVEGRALGHDWRLVGQGNWMAELSPLECSVRDLLAEADIVSLLTPLEVEQARSLVTRLRECADQARDAEYLFSEMLLRRRADSIDNRLRYRMHVPRR